MLNQLIKYYKIYEDICGGEIMVNVTLSQTSISYREINYFVIKYVTKQLALKLRNSFRVQVDFKFFKP